MTLSTKLLRGLAVASLPFTAPVAWAQDATSAEHAPPAGQTDVVKMPAKRGDRLVVAQAEPPPPLFGGPAHRGPEVGPPLPMRDPKLEPGRPPLAHALAAMETEIGIRSQQIDIWRDFTDALLAATTPPAPPTPSGEGEGRPPARKAQPFAPVLQLANDAVEYGRKAERLLKAIDSLRGTLTPEQLEKVAALESRFLSPPSGPHPPFGHGQAGPHVPRGPRPDQPGSVPTSPPR